MSTFAEFDDSPITRDDWQPSHVLAQADVEAEMWRINMTLEALGVELAKAGEEVARADVGLGSARAQALLVADGKTVGDREAQAYLQTEHLVLALKLAQALERALRDQAHNYRAQLDTLRSILASIRAQT